MIGERLARARAASSLSMRALAEQVGVSANMIKKYEHDQSMPASPILLKLAKALSVRTEYFFRPVKVDLKEIKYRKHSGTPESIIKRIHSDVLDQVERWQELANLWPNFPILPFQLPEGLPVSISEMDEIEAVANHVRKEWAIGFDPIADLIDTLEARGVLVIMASIDQGTKFDGMQASIGNQPIIVISANWPGDRQRFTLAHELGHLILHGRLSHELNEEKACNRFAGSFLLPASSIREQLGEKRHNLEVRELHLLKLEYGLSMQACLYRAKDLEIIGNSTFEKLIKLFSWNGWRKREPWDPCPTEKTYLFQQLVYRALAEDIVSESKAAELLGMPLVKFHQARKLERPDAAINQ
ncbi:XRE family transcriptional regulator [Nitrosomonas communis]|uniref:helix-turn-helix domain-containing protein n=1 Tax=Nitrosomonas communis TaxID=44574 RepID=UPI0026EEF7FD|nr:XRE family transcriptional regulator [Nitrosomonas communis]MCO6427126.1 ImmA/IrrE family metallo-endopeptidase [Nitrosomonas communis]